MSAIRLLNELESLGVTLLVQDGNLKVKAAKGAISPELLQQMKQHKPALLSLLRLRQGRDYPQSFNQAQLWFLDRLEPKNPRYNNPLAFRIKGALDQDAMGKAFDLIVQRHSILRTVFFDLQGEPRQRVLLENDRALVVIDLQSEPEKLDEIVRTEAQTGFDLEQETAIRAQLIKLGADGHVLLLNVHHICADGWSIGILVDEIFKAYEGFAASEMPEFTPLPLQYAEFAETQRNKLSSDEMQRQVDYWRAELSDAPDLLDLPTDRPRPAEQSMNGAHFRNLIDGPLFQEIDNLCQKLRVTPFAIFLAVHALVMGRFSGQSDICTGTPLAGRDQQELEGLIGHFINTVVIRAQFDDQMQLADLVAQMNDKVLGAMDHQDIAFEKVVEAVNPKRSASYSPLFQTMLIFQNMPVGEQANGVLDISPMETDSATAKYDITIELFENQDNFQLGFEYNSDLFDQSTIESMAHAFTHALKAVSSRPTISVGDIALIDLDAYRAQLHDTSALDDELTSIPARFSEVVTQFPQSRAVTDAKQHLDFAELDGKANQVAQLLSSKSIQKGDVVALSAEAGCNYVVALLGVLKAGATALPLDPSLPSERKQQILADAQAKLVFASGETAFDAPEIVDLEQLLAELDAFAATSPAVEIEASDNAILIFTSGSTGTPKGTYVTHKGLVNLATWTESVFPLGAQESVLQKSAIGFDASLWEFFWPLLSGHELVLAQGDARKNPAHLHELVNAHQIAAIQFVPATLQLFLDALPEQGSHSLKYVFCGGGALTTDLARLVTEKLPQVQLINVYGVSECAVDSAYHIFDPDRDDHLHVPIGKVISRTSICLLDEKGLPVPRGAIGEICIAGAGVGNGYHQRDELTSKTFIDHPYLPQTKLYRTGDLGVENRNGELRFIGRKDFQLKINGFRIEPGEIEAGLRRCGCALAAVIGWRDQLVAFVQGGDEPDNLQAALKQFLPTYMVPSMIIHLDQLPLNASGKIDRKALPDPADFMASNAVNQASPRDDTEMKLYRIWKNILLHPTIGIRDNFFAIGGSSISAIKMVHQIKESFGVQLALKSIITSPTIEELGAMLRGDAAERQDEDHLITLQPGDGSTNVVCVHPAGGTAFCYLSLAKTLDENIGVYGLQSMGLNANEVACTSVEDMAAHYLPLIEPLMDRPMVITGLSFGGLVAHEMGRLLSARGKQDISVVLLDTQGTHDVEARRMIDVVDLPEFRDKLVRFNGTYPGIDDAQIERYFNVYNQNRLAVRDYEVPVSGARMAFIQARSDLPRPFLHETRAYWRSRTDGEFSVKLVRGDHWEMLESDELKIVKNVMLKELDAIAPASELEVANG
ncbi:non-ribosomal peptide synthetase [Maritalea myrionectae]|uniref:non-ribosomal peptide synthetase n=1 Tax=Maritalea myrionectae TaxID=454601 RepID=UPI000412911A|nr:non-ribosomal peptide synthetase [Maritalea myrionectae]